MSTVFETQEGDSHYEEVVDFIGQLIASELARLTESQDPQAAEALKEKESFKNFTSQAKKALRERQYEEFIKIILSTSDFIGKDAKYYTSVFQVLSALICRLAQNEKDQTRLAQPITDLAMNNSKCSLSMRFKALAILFNIATSFPVFRFETLKNIFQLALKTDKASIILNHLVSLQGHCDTLKLDYKQEIELFRLALKLVDTLEEKNNKERFDVYYDFLTKINSNIGKGAFDENKAEIKGILTNILRKFPRNIDFNRFVALKAVAEFEKVDKTLYELLVIAINGDLDSFSKWKTTHAKFCSDNGINEVSIQERVTLTTFYRIAETKKTIKLGELAKTLKLNDEFEAELWVIKAMQKQELRGKIDEIEGILNIESVNQQSFHINEWKDLEAKLDGFKKQFQHFIEIVNQGLRV
mmetsp:Transcript_9895/g.11223  ORF Transcript_9895/g.11223 Transcript_9895/m.11223 type:complete len:413 (+) Transcript_9895:91-1329(+)